VLPLRVIPVRILLLAIVVISTTSTTTTTTMMMVHLATLNKAAVEKQLMTA
jgi:hypothetical protein